VSKRRKRTIGGAGWKEKLFLASIEKRNVRKELEQIELAFRAFGGGLWDYDVDADMLSCNARWYEILGIDRTQREIRSIVDFIPHIHPDDVEDATRVDIDNLAQLIANDQRYHVEFRVVRPDGTIRWLRSVACVLFDADTHHTRAVGCITDVTDMHLTPNAGASQNEGQVREIGPQADAGDPLSGRERECLAWASLGKTAWETAQILGLSRRTVEFHLENAVRKLGAGNKVHAAFIAMRRRLI